MPIDPEVQKEITDLKNKLLKMESDLTGLSGKELTETKKEIAGLKSEIAKLVAIKVTPEPVPDPKPTTPAPDSVGDPLGDFIESGKV